MWEFFGYGFGCGIALMIPVVIFFVKRVRYEADMWALLAGRYRREIEGVYDHLMGMEEQQQKKMEAEDGRVKGK